MEKAFKLLALTFFTALVTTFIGCKKNADIPVLMTTDVSAITTTSAATGGNVTSSGGVEVTARGVCWSTAENPTIADNKTNDGTGPGSFTSNLTDLNPGTTYFIRAFAINSSGIAYGTQIIFTTAYVQDNNVTQKATFPGVARFVATSFSIGTKMYLGAGGNNYEIPMRDFWEWDQTTNVWTRKADYPGTATSGVVSFSIGTKGYIGTGDNLWPFGFTNEFWEYDPATNSWTQKASLPITPARAYAVGFSIGTKGYIGLGIKDASTSGGSPGYYPDFWEWDQATNVWTEKVGFPGNARTGAVGFSIGSKGYIGTGGDGTTYSNDFWEWDQATNVWTKKADFGGMARTFAVGFSIGTKGYIGTGINENLLKDIWEWDPVTDLWTQKPDFNGGARAQAAGVSIGNKAYIGTGIAGNDFYALKDFWEYNPTIK